MLIVRKKVVVGRIIRKSTWAMWGSGKDQSPGHPDPEQRRLHPCDFLHWGGLPGRKLQYQCWILWPGAGHRPEAKLILLTDVEGFMNPGSEDIDFGPSHRTS